jgi:hypothetical protein
VEGYEEEEEEDEGKRLERSPGNMSEEAAADSRRGS